MSSIVLDLQQEVLKPECDVLNALRKAHLIASKLKLKEFDKWIMHELNGYSVKEQDEMPEYRKVNGKLKAWNPYRGWISVIFQDSEMQSLLCTKYLGSSIGEILELYNNSDGPVQMSYPVDIERKIDKMCSAPFPTNYSLHISTHVLKSIIDQVQNCLLEWTKKLENEGILGEGMRFNKDETNLAKKVPQTIYNYYGTVVNGDVQKSQIVSGDNNTVSFSYEQVSELINEVKKAVEKSEITGESRETADELIKEVESKIETRKKPAIIKAALNGLKDFLVGTGANVAGTLIMQYLQQGF